MLVCAYVGIPAFGIQQCWCAPVLVCTNVGIPNVGIHQCWYTPMLVYEYTNVGIQRYGYSQILVDTNVGVQQYGYSQVGPK
jgi:hypothetical protein